MALPIVAVVGRPNVGKSTFVNRIAQANDAIVHEMRGVTRDRSYHEADWNGIHFTLIDTGGIEMCDDDRFQGSIRSQAFLATEEADVIVFLVDSRCGVAPDDEEVARILKRSGKPVLLAVNKMDNPGNTDALWDFYQLGLGDPWPVSALHGNGTGDLLDEITGFLSQIEVDFENEEDDGAINVAIIGRPNAGKSSLTNKPVMPSIRTSCMMAVRTPSSIPRVCAVRAKSMKMSSTTVSCVPCAPSTVPMLRCWSSMPPWGLPIRISV